MKKQSHRGQIKSVEIVEVLETVKTITSFFVFSCFRDDLFISWI